MNHDELDEIIGEFVVESFENLDHIDQALISLEQHPDPDTIASIFRSVHTIKGTSGFLGFSKLEAITHVGENLLSKLRDGALSMTTEIADALLAMVDAVREILEAVQSTGGEPDREWVDLVEELGRLDRGEPKTAATTPDADEVDEESGDETVVRPIGAKVRRRKADEADAAAAAAAAAAEQEPEKIGERLLREGRIDEHQLDEALAAQSEGDPRHVGELLVEKQAISGSDVVEALSGQQEDRHISSETIRVDVKLLDDLMNFVGELVLARNQILQFTETEKDPVFMATTQRLNLITSELQEGVMKTRMQPIENVWNKFPRVVRDLTNAVGKRARLEMEGKSTELDKTLLEAIKDPLTHLVRNAVDHGLETVEDRLAAGKPAEGVVQLRARHEGGQVVVQIVDDGAGIDPAKIRRKAVERGMLTVEEAAARTDRDIVGLIFQPGFSTAATVTNISGRGVGMDVVRTNIESIGGSVDVSSTPGSGTTFTVKIPLTLAIIPALIVSCANERYAIPQVSLQELLRVSADAIEEIEGQRVHRLRGRLLPLVYLDEIFGRSTDRDREATNIVVLQADERVFGLVVDTIDDTAEIVVKPLGRYLQGVSAYAGATIMGDGHVALILDVLGLASEIGLSRGLTEMERALAATTAGILGTDDLSEQRLLIVRSGDRRFALSLETVARLEEFRADSIETANHQPVVQYGDDIMPLVHLGDALGVASDHGVEVHPAIVFNAGSKNAGVLVDEIVDIVDETIAVDPNRDHHGVLGSAIIHGRVTDLVDIHGLLRSALPSDFDSEGVAA